MFKDLVVRAQQHQEMKDRVETRKKEVRVLFAQTIEKALPELRELFPQVDFNVSNYFGVDLYIKLETGYVSHKFTYNLTLAPAKSKIMYGYGASSFNGKCIDFDYDWNDSKLIVTMKNALRAVVLQALKGLEVKKSVGRA